MRGENDLLVVAEQRLRHVGRADLVQALGGLIRHDRRGGEAQRAGDGEQVPLLAVERAGRLPSHGAEPEMREQVADDGQPL